MHPVRTAVVTGVSRADGIGAAIARRLAADGFDLFLTGWSPHDAQQPYGEDPDGGAAIAGALGAEYVALDLAEPEAPERLMAAARAALGPIDVLVANHARSSEQSLGELTATELDLSFAVNARATLLLVRHFAEQAQAAGRIVLFSSGQYHGAMPGVLPYIASKAVLQQLTATLSVALAARAITVNCINPGPNDTGYATRASSIAASRTRCPPGAGAGRATPRDSSRGCAATRRSGSPARRSRPTAAGPPAAPPRGGHGRDQVRTTGTLCIGSVGRREDRRTHRQNRTRHRRDVRHRPGRCAAARGRRGDRDRRRAQRPARRRGGGGDRGTRAGRHASSPPTSATRTTVHALAEDAGEVDILVNNAGLAWWGPTDQLAVEDFDALFATNVRGPFFLVAAFAPGMARRGAGAIVNVGSMAGSVGLPGSAAYGATKAALESMTRAWATEYSPHGVRVNSVAPGPTYTARARRRNSTATRRRSR